MPRGWDVVSTQDLVSELLTQHCPRPASIAAPISLKLNFMDLEERRLMRRVRRRHVGLAEWSEPDRSYALEFDLLGRLDRKTAVEVIPVSVVDRCHRPISVKKRIDSEREPANELDQLSSVRAISRNSVHQNAKMIANGLPVLVLIGRHKIVG
jgi:hypothetical protein